ncbi:hypothetical protein FBU30_010958 [Linnemannia zychae]|nr:hypothetical protein FBU30_010958 [Linnemannia zychae]
MRRLFKGLFQRQPVSTATALTPKRALSPFDIPLILDLIFSFLSDRTLRYSVALVSRQWFLHIQHRLYRTFSFCDTWTEKQAARLLPKLIGAGRLECILYFDTSRAATNTFNIRNILERYQEEYQRQVEQRKQIVLLDKRRPLSLIGLIPMRSISIHVSIQFETTIDSIPFPPTITNLELTFVYTRSTGENLGKIIKACPLLETFSMEVEERPGQPLTWITLDNKLQTTPLPLRSFKLRNVSFAQSNLENLLSFTPHLKSLKLMAISTCANPTYNWIRLLDHLKALRIILDSVYFFEYGAQSHITILRQMHEVCPNSTDWTLWAPNVTPLLLKTISARASVITHLELFWKPKDFEDGPICCANELKDAPRLLHEYLCSSSHLVHLKTLKTVLRPEFMDLYGRRRNNVDIDTHISPTPATALWVCRGLETLHVELHDLFCSRIFFGYISRVLPQLQELFVHVPIVCKPAEDRSHVYPGLRLGLKGGLCLLARLRSLQRLSVTIGSFEFKVTDGCTEADLNWMIPRGRTSKFRKARRVQVEKWRGMREAQDRLEAARPPQPLPKAVKEEDMEIWWQLRHLGLLRDVEEMIKEMDSKDFIALPSLERVSFTSYMPEMRHPEVELKNTIPNAALVCRQWYFLSQNKLVREVTWCQDWRAAKNPLSNASASRKLPGAYRISCYLADAQEQRTRPNIHSVLDQLELKYKKKAAARNQNSNKQQWRLYDFTPLREMIIHVHFSFRCPLDAFLFPTTLTSLVITITFAFYNEVDLSIIIQKCLLLEYLHIETFKTPGTLVTWTTPFDPKTLQPLRLRSLALCNTQFIQAYLENLLLATPNLKELTVKAAMSEYNWSQLIACLRTNNITLDKAHFSMHRTETPSEILEELLVSICPHSTEQILWTLDVTPRFLQRLFLHQRSNLTSLELYWISTSTGPPQSVSDLGLRSSPVLLHQCLCDTDHLIHLTTLKTAIRLEDLDLFERQGLFRLNINPEVALDSPFPDWSSTSSAPPSHPGIWRCRKLRNLHIEIPTTPTTVFLYAVQSRIIFGYIPRVCPFLETLQICLPQDGLNGVNLRDPTSNICNSMSFKSGLCLLGRLKYLQRLRVSSDCSQIAALCSEWELNWIMESGFKDEQSSKMRHEEMKSWEKWRAKEDYIEAFRRSKLDHQKQEQQRYVESDANVVAQLQNLGLALDVEEMAKEMETAENRPFPALEKLSFDSPIFMPLEKEFARLFPKRKKWLFF